MTHRGHLERAGVDDASTPSAPTITNPSEYSVRNAPMHHTTTVKKWPRVATNSAKQTTMDEPSRVKSNNCETTHASKKSKMGIKIIEKLPKNQKNQKNAE